VMGIYASGHWNDFLKFIHASSFGIKEPIFGKDAGFYIFKLPTYDFITCPFINMVDTKFSFLNFLLITYFIYLKN